MGGRSVRVLHISDLYMRSADGPQAARVRLKAAARWRAPGAKWTANLAEMHRDQTDSAATGAPMAQGCACCV